MKKIMFLSLLFFVFYCYGQHDRVWHFGINAGLSFPANGGAPSPFTGPISTNEGTASISDVNGNIIFSTDGIKVFNSIGTFVNPTQLLHGASSSSTSAAIVPKPGTANRYYIFTLGEQVTCGLNCNGLKYTEVVVNGSSITFQNLNTPLLAGSETTELMATQKIDNNTYRLATIDRLGYGRYWEITASGIGGINTLNDPISGYPVSNHSSVNIPNKRKGILKFSKSGKLLVASSEAVNNNPQSIAQSSISWYNLNCNEYKSKSHGITFAATGRLIGFEISPNDQYIYASFNSGKIIQINLNNYPSFTTTTTTIYTATNLTSEFQGRMQLGPDDKIYIANGTEVINSNHLDVIPNPNSSTPTYLNNNITLNPGTFSRLGLPNFYTFGSSVGFELLKQDVSCKTGQDGTINVNITCGIAPYTYSWSHSSSINSSSVYGLNPGSYSVTVTDNWGRQEVKTITIEEPQITHSMTIVPSACGNSINIFSSSPNHTITGIIIRDQGVQINGSPFPWSPNFSLNNLPGGNYTYELIYNGNNSQTCTTNVSTPQFLPYGLSLTLNSTDNTCLDGISGTANVLIVGGTSPYYYNWSNGETSNSINNLSSGTYTVTVTDVMGCSQVASTTINDPNISFTHSKIDACNNNGIGSITVGGSIPAGYSVGGVSFFNNGTLVSTSIVFPATLNNLSSGSYTYWVIYGPNGNGCLYEENNPVEIIPDFQLTTNIIDESCFGKEDGEITTLVSGGTGNFTYNWSTGSNQPNINNLGGGLVTLTVNDQGVCTKTRNLNVGSTPVEWQQTSKQNSGNDRGYDVSVDTQGNTYFVGTYHEYTVLGKTNSWAQIPYNNQEPVNNMFLVKIDDCGEIVWARHSESNSKYEYCEGRALVLDEDNDRVFVAAYTNDAQTVTFIDEISPINHLTPAGLNAYTIVIEYQMSDGDLIHLYDDNKWCPDKIPEAITIDNNSRYLYLVGNFPYGSNGYVERLDIDNQVFDHYLDLPTTTMTDVEFNKNTEQLYISGSYYDNVNFINNTITHPANSTPNLYDLGFIAEITEFSDPSLVPNPNVFDLVWSSNLGNDMGSRSQVNDMSINAMNNIAMTGYYEGTLIDPFYNPNVNNGQGFSSIGNDVFVAYVDQNGQWNQQQSWMEVATQSSYSVGNGIAFNDAGTLFIHGDYTGSDLEFGGQNAAYLGGTQTFSIAFEDQGNAWASNWMATTKAGNNAQYEVYSNAIAANDDYIFTTGIYLNTLDFSPTGNSSSISGGSDAYAYFVRNDIHDNGKFQRLKNISSNLDIEASSLKAFPNPSSGNFNLSFEAEQYTNIVVRDLVGKVIKEIQLTHEENQLQLDLSEQANGVYFVTAIGKDKRETIKISKQ